MEVIKEVLQVRDRVAVRDSDFVKSPAVAAEPELAESPLRCRLMGEAQFDLDGRSVPLSSCCRTCCLVAFGLSGAGRQGLETCSGPRVSVW